MTLRCTWRASVAIVTERRHVEELPAALTMGEGREISG
jgi:hypothetical protein